MVTVSFYDLWCSDLIVVFAFDGGDSVSLQLVVGHSSSSSVSW